MQANVRGLAADRDIALAQALYDVVRGARRLRDDDPVDLVDAQLLGQLKQLGPVRPSALAAGGGLDASSVSRRLARLERDRLVERSADPADARASLIVITADGAAVLRQVLTNRAAALRLALADWDDDDRERLERLLHRLADDLAEGTDGPGGRR